MPYHSRSKASNCVYVPISRCLHLLHYPSLSLELPPRPFRHAKRPVNEQCGGDIESAIRQRSRKLPPSVPVIDAELRESVVRACEGAELALRGAVGVQQRASRRSEIGGHEGTTGRCVLGLEAEELRGGADDGCGADGGGYEGGGEVRHGRDAVHEDPEAGEGCWSG